MQSSLEPPRSTLVGCRRLDDLYATVNQPGIDFLDAEGFNAVVQDLPREFRVFVTRLIWAALFFTAISGAAAQNDPKPLDAAALEAETESFTRLATEARVYWEKGDYQKALPLYEQTLAISERVVGRDHPELRKQLILIGNMHAVLGNADKALTFFQRSLDITEKAAGAPDNDDAKVATLLGMGPVLAAQGKHGLAILVFERCLAIQEAHSGAAHADLVSILIGLANSCNSQRDHERALRLFQRSLAIIESAYGKDSAMAGLVLFKIGVSYSLRGDDEKAVLNLEQCLVRINSLPDDNQDLETKANLHWMLGMSYKSLLKWEQAIQAFKQSLWFNEKLLGIDSPKLVEVLISIADLYLIQQRPSEGIPLLERALAINEKSFGKESTEAARVLASLGNMWSEAGQFGPALNCLKRSLELREKTPGTNSVEAAIAFYNLGSLFGKWGDHSQAIPLLARAVEILERNHVSNDVQYAFQLAGALNNLGTVQVEGGDYKKGIAALQRSLAVAESAFGSASINLVSALNSLAVACRHHGDFECARRFYERALRILEGAPADKNRERVDTMNNLAQMFLEIGDEDAALKLFSTSQALGESQLGVKELRLAFSLNGLALINQGRGNMTEALSLFERSLAILESKLGASNREVAGVLNNIAALLENTGDTNRALSTLQRTLAIQEKILPEIHPDIAATLNNLAGFSLNRGNLTEAQRLFRRSVAVTDAAIGRDNPDSCARLENLGVVEFLGGDASKGLAEFVESARRWRRYLASQTLFQQNPSASRFQEKVQSSRDWFHSLCAVTPANFLQAASFSGAEQLAFGKALLEEVETVRARLTADGRVQVQALREQANSIQSRLEASASRESAAWLQERMDWRNSERDKLEHELKAIEENIADASGLVAQTIREGDLSLTQIASSLPPNSVLVDLIEYRRTDFSGGSSQWKEQRYAAYLTFPLLNDSTNIVLQRVDLGEAMLINEALGIIAKRFSAKQYLAKDLPPAFQRLSDLVYAPLAPYLTNTSHLIICPDGELSRLPFEMLPFGNKFLMEEKTISYVTSGREIVRLAANQSNHKPRTQTAKSLVMGNPDFDLDLASARSASPPVQIASSAAALRSVSRDFRGLTFEPLPGAETEARSVAKLLGSESELRLGAEAREAELKAVKSPRVLHLATHGFFLSDQDFKRTNALAWSSPFPQSASRRGGSPNDWENPLVRCGIALAGANRAQQITNAIAENGVLTGLEASLLNFQGTELVILSACQSGAGDVRVGEGVMSLRRAFRIAGAETVLASHWSVSDKATTLLMTEFMRRWRAGEPRAKAWREAQLALLRSKDFSSPYFWASFTLTGQWR